MNNVQQLLDILEGVAPTLLAARWDNVGLLVGSPRSRVSTVLLALDPTVALVAEAQALAADLIITHHPAIFQPLKQIRTDLPGGAFLTAALRAGISVIGCHTNFDAAFGGVSDVLAEALELRETVPLAPDNAAPCSCGIGRIGNLPMPLQPEAFLQHLQTVIPMPWLLEAGSRPARELRRVAVCGGSCADLAERALAAGADVFLTAEIKHHLARWAEEAGLWLLDGGHFATENPAMRRLMQSLAERTRQVGVDLQFHLAAQESPLRLIR